MKRVSDFRQIVCGPQTSIRETMGRINTSPYQFQLVIDQQAGRLLGTVTDGDIRRAILRSVSLDAQVSSCMQTKPIVGRTDSDRENAKKLLDNRALFLPVVDEDGVLREILLAQDSCVKVTTALVMAGGFGRRLGPRTETRPKPLLEIGDKPILEHVLSWLDRNGVVKVFLSVHYLADQIETFITTRNFRIQPQIIREEQALGTAGSIAELPRDTAGPILVVNGDVLTDLDLRDLAAFHEGYNYDGTIAVSPYSVSVPFGVIGQEGEGLFSGIEEKPTFNYFVAAGIYLLDSTFCCLVPPNTQMDMPDLLNLGRKAGLRIGLFPLHEHWIDVGRPDDLMTAERKHRK